MNKALITGGSGDLGTVLTPLLTARGYEVVRLDVRPPADSFGRISTGSVLDRGFVASQVTDANVVIHIAGWHGFHETHELRSPEEFWDLNMTGTFNVLDALRHSAAARLVFISSTSARHNASFYGLTKVLGEELIRWHACHRGLRSVILRPRAFIPHWNRAAYKDYTEWARWFWRGAVHIGDVADACCRAMEALKREEWADPPVLPVDGAYDVSPSDLANWDADGPGTSFARHYPEFVDLAARYQLDTTVRPVRIDMSETQTLLHFVPHFSLRSMLEELREFGASGPRHPFEDPRR